MILIIIMNQQGNIRSSKATVAGVLANAVTHAVVRTAAENDVSCSCTVIGMTKSFFPL